MNWKAKVRHLKRTRNLQVNLCLPHTFSDEDYYYDEDDYSDYYDDEYSDSYEDVSEPLPEVPSFPQPGVIAEYGQQQGDGYVFPPPPLSMFFFFFPVQHNTDYYSTFLRLKSFSLPPTDQTRTKKSAKNPSP